MRLSRRTTTATSQTPDLTGRATGRLARRTGIGLSTALLALAGPALGTTAEAAVSRAAALAGDYCGDVHQLYDSDHWIYSEVAGCPRHDPGGSRGTVNNLGAAPGRPVVVMLNDNGRSYAPTTGALANHGNFEWGLMVPRYRNPDGLHHDAVRTTCTFTDTPSHTGPPPVPLPAFEWWWEL